MAADDKSSDTCGEKWIASRWCRGAMDIVELCRIPRQAAMGVNRMIETVHFEN